MPPTTYTPPADPARPARNALEHLSRGGTLAERRRVQGPTPRRIAAARLVELARAQAGGAIATAALSGAPVLELSARQPYADGRGNMDVYHPGRWDTSSDLVYMAPIVATGPSVGEWDGTVVYASFTPPGAGAYLVVAHFSGYDTTMKLNGPWGTNTAYTAATSDAGAVTALWDGAGEALSFTLSCAGTGLGYLASIQVFPA